MRAIRRLPARAALLALLTVHAGGATGQSSRGPAIDEPERDRAAEPAPDDEPRRGENGAEGDGGDADRAPAGPPGLFTVDEEAAVRALERSLIQADALLLSPGQLELGFGLAFGVDRRSSPVLLQDAGGGALFGGSVDTRLETLGADVELQIGLPFRSQFGIAVPLNSHRMLATTRSSGAVVAERDATSTDVGDVRVAFLKTLVQERGARPDLIALLAYDADSASDLEPPVGSGAAETSLGLNATKRQDPLVFTAGLSHTVSSSDRGFRPGAVTQLSIGAFLAASPYTSLRMGFTQRHVDDAELDDEALLGTDGISASLELGASSVVSRSVFAAADLEVGLTGVEADYRFALRLSRRFDVRR